MNTSFCTPRGKQTIDNIHFLMRKNEQKFDKQLEFLIKK